MIKTLTTVGPNLGPDWNNNQPEHIIIHHSATFNGDVNSFDRYHRLQKGWVAVGYHYVIDKKGNIQLGRMETTSGAHSVGWNNNSIGICLVGHFDYEIPTDEQLIPASSLATNLCQRYGITSLRVISHKQSNIKRCGKPLKTCPGNNFPMNYLTSLVSKNMYKGIIYQLEVI